jgi:MFS family permease
MTYSQIESEFHVQPEITALGLTLFILGLGLGPRTYLSTDISSTNDIHHPCILQSGSVHLVNSSVAVQYERAFAPVFSFLPDIQNLSRYTDLAFSASSSSTSPSLWQGMQVCALLHPTRRLCDAVIETWLVGRFLSGVSGSAFLSLSGGTVSDLFAPKKIGIPMAVYSASPFLGLVLYVYSGYTLGCH